MSTATNELENAIRFAGKVTNGIQTYSVEGNSVGRLTAKSQDIVEIGIEDLLALFEAQRTRIELEAKDQVLDELLQWFHFWESMHEKPFNWYGAVQAIKISKDHRKPFNTLTALDRKEEK